MQRRRHIHALGKGYGLFATAFGVFVLVTAILGQFGLVDGIVAWLVLIAALAAFVVVGASVRSLSLSEFLFAGRGVPAGVNGLATAAAFLTAGGVVGLAGTFFADATTALAVIVGWSIGFVLLVVLVAPYFRKSGAITLPDFLAVRFGGRLIRSFGIVIVLGIAAVLVPGSIVAAASLAQTLVDIDANTALIGTVAVILASALFGGMRAVTVVAGAQMIVALFGILAPAAVASLRDYGLPIPHLAFGGPAAEIAAASPVATLASRLQPLADLDGLNWLGFAGALAFGIACLPHVLVRSATCPGIADARRSAAWALAVVAVVAMTAPAIAALARIVLLQGLVGIDFADLPPWLFVYGARGSIQVCGVDAVSAAALGTACGAVTVLNGLTPADIALARDSVLLGFAGFTGLPFVLSALIATAVISLALATATAMLVAAAACIGHDAYGMQIDRRATAGKRLVVSRLALVGLTALAGWLASRWPGEMLAVTPVAPCLAASAFFAPIVLGIWWRATTPGGALAGMILGFATSAAYVVLTEIGVVDRWSILGLTQQGLAPAAAAVFGVPASIAATVAVSLLAAKGPESGESVVDAIRRPSPDPILEDRVT